MRLPLALALLLSAAPFLSASPAPAASPPKNVPGALPRDVPGALPRDVPGGHWAAGSVRRVTHEKIMGRDVDGRFRGDKPVTRYELAVALDRFVRYIESSQKPLHRVTAPAPTLPASASRAEGAALSHLVSSGFLPADSPLVTKDGRAPVSATELADALAAVTTRLSDRGEPPPAQ